MRANKFRLNTPRSRDRVVVGGNHHRARLYQVRAEQERIARTKHFADLLQESLARGPVEVADGRAKEKHQ